MSVKVHRVQSAGWRKSSEDEFERLHLKRGRLRVEEAFAAVFFYLEDRNQVRTLYAQSEQGKRIEIELHLEEGGSPQIVVGIPKLAAPPYTHPPFHLRMQVERSDLAIQEPPAADQ